MGGIKHQKTEGGQGGRRGHSNMDHSSETAEIKEASRGLRRRESKRAISLELRQLPGRGNPRPSSGGTAGQAPGPP